MEFVKGIANMIKATLLTTWKSEEPAMDEIPF